MINDKLISVVKNLTKKTMRVPAINWKQSVAKWKTFECHKRDADALMRMYSWYFAVVETKTVNVKDNKEVKKENKTDESKAVAPVVPPVEEKTADVIELEKAREAYAKKMDNEVPVNKKNDLGRIKGKLKDL